MQTDVGAVEAIDAARPIKASKSTTDELRHFDIQVEMDRTSLSYTRTVWSEP